MTNIVQSPYLVPFDGSFSIANSPTSPPPAAPDRKECKKLLKKVVEEMDDLQRILYAHDHHSVLLIFQAMDAAGKDSTIRAVTRGINPAGCQVHSFKKPSDEELDHDFLWRTNKALPERGRIGIFNRSYYEEVLVVRVHPKILNSQKLPGNIDPETIWEQRFHSIREFEKHAYENGTLIIKFWLNVSKDEQKNRFLSRLNEPEKHWKFSANDITERGYWEHYMNSYQEALNATSRPWAPWYAIPADDKPFMRLRVAELILLSLQNLDMQYPKVNKEDKKRFDDYRKQLEDE